VRLVPPGRVVGQVLTDAVKEIAARPGGARFLRLPQPGGHGRPFLRMREFPARGELRGHPRHLRPGTFA